MKEGWVCPKCGRVYSPIMPECHQCNTAIRTSLQPCLACGGYHPVNSPCPKFTVTSEVAWDATKHGTGPLQGDY